MGTTTTFVYDKSRRLTTQHSSAEAHYYTYNQRNMVTQIQDVKPAGADPSRYFSYNAVGERVYGVDGTATPSYWAYDGGKMLSESIAGTTARYQHNHSPLPWAGSVVEHISALDFTLSYPVFKEDGSVMQMRIGPARDGFETSRFGVVLGSSVVATTPPSHRLQNMSTIFMTSIAMSQQMNLTRLGRLYLAGQALNVVGGLFFDVTNGSTTSRQRLEHRHWEDSANSAGNCGQSLVLRQQKDGFGKPFPGIGEKPGHDTVGPIPTPPSEPSESTSDEFLESLKKTSENWKKAYGSDVDHVLEEWKPAKPSNPKAPSPKSDKKPEDEAGKKPEKEPDKKLCGLAVPKFGELVLEAIGGSDWSEDWAADDARKIAITTCRTLTGTRCSGDCPTRENPRCTETIVQVRLDQIVSPDKYSYEYRLRYRCDCKCV